MKKSILNLGKILNKIEQQEINGSRGIDGCPNECYGIPDMGCRSCQEYFSLSSYCQMRVRVGIECFGM
ncbi:hypothetical protein [Tenacibaculum crassostreae]|uniref:hypothetical protein n=1 Tax=Tenacibaculum crassostreae TaxID=502683 RepID=UPI003895A4D8